jgi:hypothetical protein
LDKLPWQVERLIPSQPQMKKVDLWNLFDLVYLDPTAKKIGFVQTTSWSNRAHRKRKLEDQGQILFLLHSIPGAMTELHAWRKIQGEWTIRVYSTTLDSKGEAVLKDVPHVAMKDVRAKVRKRKKIEEAQRRVVRPVPVGLFDQPSNSHASPR